MPGFNSIDVPASLRSQNSKSPDRCTDVQYNGVLCYATEIIFLKALEQNNNIFSDNT